MNRTALRAQPLGDSAVTISFGTTRSSELLARIHATARALDAARLAHVEDIVPSYLAITVFYDAHDASYATMEKELLAACERASLVASSAVTPREHTIPIRYDGPDLDFVASACDIAVGDVISRHAARSYTVDFLGFVPGFGYLSELDPSLQLARRNQPRPRVPGGSVAIAGAQTAVYPLDTPGGWHIIGHTNLVMFDPTRTPPALLAAGDVVRFAVVP